MKKYKLGDLIDVNRGTSLSGEFYSATGNYVRLTLGNFDYRLNTFKENNSKEDIYYTGDFDKKFLLKKGDIITPLTEQVKGLIGSTAKIPLDNKYIQSQDVALVKTKSYELDNNFLFYLISSNYVRVQLSNVAQQTKIRHTSPDKIKDAIVYLPKINQQKKISLLLDNIMKKIEINNEIINKSESFIKMVYNCWFLQYEFPDDDGKPYKSSGGEMVYNDLLKKEIPKNWNDIKLLDIENNIVTGKTPSTKNSDYFDGDIPFITIDDIRKGTYIISTERTLSVLGADTQQKKYLPENSICVSCIATVGLVAMTTKKSQTNQQINTIICKNDYNRYYLFNAIKEYFNSSSGAKTGNIFANMNKNDFESIKLIYPEKKVLMKFNHVVAPFYNKIKLLLEENKELTNLKDYLLPLLMNGQVGFKN